MSNTPASLTPFQSTRPRRARPEWAGQWKPQQLFQSTRPRRARPLETQWTGYSLSCFNPRAHEGRDFPPELDINPEVRVSIHAPTKGATRRSEAARHHGEVSIHAPTKGATRYALSIAGVWCVSIHAPTKGATFSATYVTHFHLTVSIHAPTKGATVRMMHFTHTGMVSIHAPTKGATASIVRMSAVISSFNPRAHEGRDRYECLHERGMAVSIHAPTKGATRSVNSSTSSGEMFQSTRPRRARRLLSRLVVTTAMFQSTRPRRARPFGLVFFCCRAHVSIHAPTKGATPLIGHSRAPGTVSIHAPTKGATSARPTKRPPWRCFNPRAHEGRDHDP